jgi:hypothetical protein
VYLKSIGDCIRSRDESIETHLDPPLFWLDNIFKSAVNRCQPAYVAYVAGRAGTTTHAGVDFIPRSGAKNLATGFSHVLSPG